MKEDRRVSKTTTEPAAKSVHPDKSGFRQHYPDKSGFRPGEESTEKTGEWTSNFPDSHGWHHSSTKE